MAETAWVKGEPQQHWVFSSRLNSASSEGEAGEDEFPAQTQTLRHGDTLLPWQFWASSTLPAHCSASPQQGLPVHTYPSQPGEVQGWREQGLTALELSRTGAAPGHSLPRGSGTPCPPLSCPALPSPPLPCHVLPSSVLPCPPLLHPALPSPAFPCPHQLESAASQPPQPDLPVPAMSQTPL